MKKFLSLFLLITAFTSPCAQAMEEVSFSIEEPTNIKKEFNEFAELFTTATTFDAIKEKLEASSDKKALVTYSESILVGTGNRETLLHLLISSELADDIKIETIKLFVESGADINVRDSSKNTLLFHAIEKDSSIEIITTLIELGAHLQRKSGAREAPLFLAIEKNKIEIVQLLIQKGANVNEHFNSSDQTEYLSNLTPLHHAIMKGCSLDIIELLIQKGADIDALYTEKDSKDGMSATPLFIAARKDRVDIIRLLLVYGADRSIICCGNQIKEQSLQDYLFNREGIREGIWEVRDKAEIDALLATPIDPEKAKLPKKSPPSQPSSWSTSGKVGLTFAVVATGIGAYYLYKKYQDKKKLDEKKKAAQEKKEKIEPAEKVPVVA